MLLIHTTITSDSLLAVKSHQNRIAPSLRPNCSGIESEPNPDPLTQQGASVRTECITVLSLSMHRVQFKRCKCAEEKVPRPRPYPHQPPGQNARAKWSSYRQVLSPWAKNQNPSESLALLRLTVACNDHGNAVKRPESGSFSMNTPLEKKQLLIAV